MREPEGIDAMNQDIPDVLLGVGVVEAFKECKLDSRAEEALDTVNPGRDNECRGIYRTDNGYVDCEVTWRRGIHFIRMHVRVNGTSSANKSPSRFRVRLGKMQIAQSVLLHAHP